MKLALTLAASLLMMGCSALSPQQDEALVKTGASILCVLENVELDDPNLNQACQDILKYLTPGQVAAIRAARDKRMATPKKECAQ